MSKPKVIVCIPSGRRKYMECLLPHLLVNHMDAIDHINLWMNPCFDSYDRRWLEEIGSRYPNSIHLIESTPAQSGTEHHRYYYTCTEPNTIYVKIDDDIVWLAKDAIAKLVAFRIDNPQYLLTIGNVVNNALCNYWHMENGIYPKSYGITRNGLDDKSISDTMLANLIHNTFLSRCDMALLSDYTFENKVMWDYEFSPIHVFAWKGSDFFDYTHDGKFKIAMCSNGVSEERWLSTVRTREVNRKIAFCGHALFTHFSYTGQRVSGNMDEARLLEGYRKLTPEWP